VKQRPELDNLSTDHVTIQSELKYLIEGKVVMLKCQVYGGQTSPFPMGWVFRVVRPIAMNHFWVELDLEPTWQFGPVANTNNWYSSNWGLQ